MGAEVVFNGFVGREWTGTDDKRVEMAEWRVNSPIKGQAGMVAEYV